MLNKVTPPWESNPAPFPVSNLFWAPCSTIWAGSWLVQSSSLIQNKEGHDLAKDRKIWAGFYIRTTLRNTAFVWQKKLSISRWDLYPGALDVLDQNTQVSVLSFVAKSHLHKFSKLAFCNCPKAATSYTLVRNEMNLTSREIFSGVNTKLSHFLIWILKRSSKSTFCLHWCSHKYRISWW